MNVNYKRDVFVDIIRFIAIISIVIGHAFNTDLYYSDGVDTVRKFVYIYHIAAFFWCSGYMWKLKPVRKTIVNIVKKQYLKTTIVALISLLIIPLWLFLGVIENIGIMDLASKVVHIVLYQPSGGVFVGALWFMPFFTVSVIIFEIIMRVLKNEKCRVAACILLGCAGLYFVNRDMFSTYYLNFALLMQLILLLGYLSKNYGSKVIDKVAQWFWPIPALLLILLNLITGYEVELSKHHTYGPFFYFVVIIGLVFCVSLAKCLARLKHASALAWIGQHSFEIMAFHFMMFKLLDGVVGKVTHNNAQADLLAFPISHETVGFRILYVVVGVGGSILICKIIEMVKNRLIHRKKGGEMV